MKGDYIMSKWTDIRDAIVKEINVDQVTEEVKQRVTRTILAECIPAIEQAVDKFVTKRMSVAGAIGAMPSYSLRSCRAACGLCGSCWTSR